MNFGSQFSSWSRLQTTFFLLADRRSSRLVTSFFASRRLWSCGPRHQARSAPAGGQRPRCGGSARFRRLPLPCAGDPRSVCVRRYAARGHPADFHAPADGRFGAIKPPTHFDVCACIPKKHTVRYRNICTSWGVHMCMFVAAKYIQIHSDMHMTTCAYLNVYWHRIQSDTNRYAHPNECISAGM